MLPWVLRGDAMTQTTRDTTHGSDATTALSSNVSGGPAEEYERDAYGDRGFSGRGR